ncbi:hypothetical protein PTKIN_Ptkin03bG0141100 [Pterospermum kingtungense]
MLLRDENESFLCCRTLFHYGLIFVKEAKLIALLEALYWVRDLGWDHVIFEMDAQKVVNVVTRNVDDQTKFGAMIAQAKSVLTQMAGFQVTFTKRQANAMVVTLARASHSYVSPMLWNSIPFFLVLSLESDCIR